nr:PfkB family carbohydrate kinase [Microlunatus panaciterrae]
MDLTYLVESLRLGAIHRPTSVVRCAGGKSLNLARAATAVGADVTVVAILGGQTGTGLARSLAAAGIEVVAVDTPAETRTCVSIAAADTGELTEVYEYAPEIPVAVWQRFAAQTGEALAGRTGWLAVSGGAPSGLHPTALAELVRLGRRHGVKVAVDSHSAALPAAVDAGPDLVKVNRAEAADLLGLAVETELVRMAEAIRERTGGMVVLTDGDGGAVGVDDQGAVRVGLPPLRGRFPVGSGDSFLGGLLASLDAGGSLAESLALATACGVANALVPGPGQFDPAAVADLRGQVVAVRE